MTDALIEEMEAMIEEADTKIKALEKQFSHKLFFRVSRK